MVSLLLLAGCNGGSRQVKVKSVDGPAEDIPEESPAEVEQPEMEVHAVEEDKPEPEPAPVFKRDPFCGDNNCDSDENCDSCYEDCACTSPAECSKGRCVVPECGSNGDCKDDDPCTRDTCFFAGHVNAYCGTKPELRCRDDDGCCPKDCNANDDDDCESDCGNGVCESGEDADDCPEDCQ